MGGSSVFPGSIRSIRWRVLRGRRMPTRTTTGSSRRSVAGMGDAGHLAYLGEQRALRAIAAATVGSNMGSVDDPVLGRPLDESRVARAIIGTPLWRDMRALLIACYMDGFAIGWKGRELRETCPTCGLPDNCGDCDHAGTEHYVGAGDGAHSRSGWPARTRRSVFSWSTCPVITGRTWRAISRMRLA